MNLFEEFNNAGNYYEIDNKILKYKLKKKKLLQKITNTLEEKNKLNTNLAKKIPFVKELIQITKLNAKDNNVSGSYIFVIITGLYSVGKSSLVGQIEKIIGSEHTLEKINVEDNANILTKYTLAQNFASNLSGSKIVYVEANIKQIDNIYSILQNNVLYVGYVIPASVEIWKNRLVNKFFTNIKKNVNITGSDINECVRNILQNIFTNIPNEMVDTEYDFEYDISSQTKNIFDDNDFANLNQVLQIPYTYANSVIFNKSYESKIVKIFF